MNSIFGAKNGSRIGSVKSQPGGNRGIIIRPKSNFLYSLLEGAEEFDLTNITIVVHTQSIPAEVP